MMDTSMFHNKDKEIKRLRTEVKDLLAYLHKILAWIEGRYGVIIADSLSLSYTYKGVTFKSNNNMSISNLPKGQSVILTLGGTGKDSTGAVVSAPITAG